MDVFLVFHRDASSPMKPRQNKEEEFSYTGLKEKKKYKKCKLFQIHRKNSADLQGHTAKHGSSPCSTLFGLVMPPPQKKSSCPRVDDSHVIFHAPKLRRIYAELMSAAKEKNLAVGLLLMNERFAVETPLLLL